MLPIADAAHRRQVGRERVARAQRGELAHESRRQHRVEALRDSGVQRRAILRDERNGDRAT
jgi:hypothetical protein